MSANSRASERKVEEIASSETMSKLEEGHEASRTRIASRIIRRRQARKEESESKATASKESKESKTSIAIAGKEHAVKTCYFFHDQEQRFQEAVKLVIGTHQFKQLDGLMNVLTERMPSLACGVRTIRTPCGRHEITSVHHLANEGRYLCSSNVYGAKSVDVGKLCSAPRWSNARPPSGRRLYSRSLRLYKGRNKTLLPCACVNKSQYPPTRSKKLFLRRLHDPRRKLLYMLDRNAVLDFPHFISGKFSY